MENGETLCKSPQLNGDISDKSALETNCELTKADNLCIDKDSSNEVINKDIPENGKTISKSDQPSENEVKSYDNHSDTDTSGEKSLDSDDKTVKSDVCTKGDEVSDLEISKNSSEDSVIKSKEDTTVNERSSAVSEGESKPVESSSSEDIKEDNGDKSVGESSKEEPPQSSENDSANNENKTKDSENKKAANEADKKDIKPDKKTEKSQKKKDDVKPEIVKRVTRSSSGVAKPVKYIDPDPKGTSDEEDDDDIKITKEVKKDEGSDIEMIEESDPLAISDADVKKAKEANKTVSKFLIIYY